jgi:hypothetical protein
LEEAAIASALATINSELKMDGRLSSYSGKALLKWASAWQSAP